jgi:integrase
VADTRRAHEDGADHLVPLSRQAAELFHELKPISCGSAFMFPNLGRLDKPMSKSTLNVMFDRLKLDVTPHAVRATTSTLLNESGLFRGDVIERALAHAERNRVRASYNAAEYLPERRAMLSGGLTFWTACGQAAVRPAPREMKRA